MQTNAKITERRNLGRRPAVASAIQVDIAPPRKAKILHLLGGVLAPAIPL